MVSDSRSLTSRMIRAAKLEVDLYEEVEADTKANGQALQAVVVASLAGGVGGSIAGLSVEGGPSFFWGLVFGLLAAIVGWVTFAVLTYWLGTTIFRGPQTSATYGELLRTIGFSNSPRVLTFFVFIPVLGGLIAFAASMWALIAAGIAVRQALDFSTARAIGTCVVGWIISTLLTYLIIILMFGGEQLF